MTVIVLATVASPCFAASDATDLAVEDLAMNLLASTNRNLGLAQKLYESDPKSSRVVLDCIRQTESTAKNVAITLRMLRDQSDKTDAHRQTFNLLNTGLMSVVKQSRALRDWVKADKSEALVTYHEERVNALRSLEELSNLSHRKVEAPAE
jgi:hypothetical protein